MQSKDRQRQSGKAGQSKAKQSKAKRRMTKPSQAKQTNTRLLMSTPWLACGLPMAYTRLVCIYLPNSSCLLTSQARPKHGQSMTNAREGKTKQCKAKQSVTNT
jgi:hypothetical protein